MGNNKTTFFHDTVKIVSGSTISAILNALLMPVVARLFAPDVLGLNSIYLSIASIISVVICLRYEQSIVLPESDPESANLLFASLIFAMTFSVLLIPLIAISKSPFLNLINAGQLEVYIYVLPLHSFFIGLDISATFWNTRKKRFSNIAIASVVFNGSALTIMILGGLLVSRSVNVLIAAYVGGRIFSALIQGLLILIKDHKLLFDSFNFKKILEGIKRYKKFPKYGIGSILLGTISWQLPNFLLSSFFSTTITGYYSLAYRVIKMPMSLIGDSISRVFLKYAVDANHRGSLKKITTDVFTRLITLGILPVLILTLFGKDLFILVFGSNWSESGVYVQILGVWVLFWFLSGPFTMVFSILERQELQLLWNIVNLITRFGSLILGGILGNPRLSFLFFSITGVLVYGWKVWFSMKITGVNVWLSIREKAKDFILNLPIVVLFVAKLFINLSPVLIVVTLTLYSILYYSIMIKSDPFIMETIAGWRSKKI